MTMSSPQERDACFVIDATQSMEHALAGVARSLPQVMHLVRVSEHRLIRRVGVLVYRDYSEGVEHLTWWSGWTDLEDGAGIRALAQIVKSTSAFGGRDYSEAAKTAAVHLLDRVLADLPAIVFWYTDAPPHHASFMLPRRHRAATFTDANHHAEQNALETRSFDWIGLCRDIASTGSTVFPITFAFANDNRVACFYAALADLTGGTCLHIRTTREMSSVIAQVTIGVVMRLAGHDHVFEEDDVVRVRLDCEDLGRLRSDRDCDGHLPDDSQCVKACARGAALLRVRGDDTVRMEELFSRDAAFRDVVYSTFEDVLSPEYVEALTHNAVFGKLWRAICRNRFDPRQARLLAKMSESLSLVTDETVRGTLRDFLESSYDESERILRACTAATTLHDHQDGLRRRIFRYRRRLRDA